MAHRSPERPHPSVWILTRGRQGDLDQMQTLAAALGWPAEVKRLDFHHPHIPAFASVLLKRQSDALDPPWPDLLICSEALPSVIAYRLKKKSGGRIRIVCLGRPAGDPAGFDLILTTAQYRLPPAHNIVQLALPLSGGSGISPEAATPLADDVVRPLIVLAVGGSSFPDRLDARAASEMATAVRAFAQAQRGTAWAFTSPRTDGVVAEALVNVLAPPHRVHVYSAGPENPYRSALAAADCIIVTSDSVSMVSDALLTGKPVQVYPLPQSHNFEWHLMAWLYRHAVLSRAPWLAPLRWLFQAGVFEVSADRRLLFGALVAQHRLSWFGAARPAPVAVPPNDDLDLAVRRVRGLF